MVLTQDQAQLDQSKRAMAAQQYQKDLDFNEL